VPCIGRLLPSTTALRLGQDREWTINLTVQTGSPRKVNRTIDSLNTPGGLL